MIEMLFFGIVTALNAGLFAKIVEIQGQVSEVRGNVEVLKDLLTQEQRDYGWPRSDPSR